MSALSLCFPHKPSELADDLESFIYVVLYMVFRFHAHNLSPSATKKDTVEQQMNANGVNTALAIEVHHFFYQDDNSALGYYSGGKSKLTYINNGEPPISLHSPQSLPSLLAPWLKRAYGLLKSHYKAVDLGALKAYAAPGTNEPWKPDPQPQPAQRKKNAPNPFAKKTAFKTGEAPLTMLASTGSKPSSVAGKRVLDRHDAVCELFDSFFKNESGQRLEDFDQYRGDEFFDQFNGLKAYVVLGVKDSSAGSKRQVEVVEAPDSPARKVPRHGFTGEIHLRHPDHDRN